MYIEKVKEPLRNSYETLSTENLIILRNFQHLPKFLEVLKKVWFFHEFLEDSSCTAAPF